MPIITLPMAVAGSAVLGAGASIGSALIGSNAADKASQAQAQAARESLAFQKQVYADQQANLAPWRAAGLTAVGNANTAIGGLAPYQNLGAFSAQQLGALYGNGSGGKPDYSGFTNSPDYNFAYDQGLRATSNMLGASGTLRGGAGAAALTNFGQGLASQQYGNYFSRLMGLTGIGQQAAGQAIGGYSGIAQMGLGAATGGANFGANMAGTIGNTMGGLGQAQASGIVGSANAWSGGLTGAANAGNSAMGNYMQYNLLSGLINKGGSSYGGGPMNLTPPGLYGGGAPTPGAGGPGWS